MPYLFRDHSQIFPFVGKPDWNLTTAMADDAIAYLRQLNASGPEQPFFLYYVPGGTLSPHHPTKEWIDKIQAMHLFDNGWNRLRDTIFANQKRLGVIPRTPGGERDRLQAPAVDRLDFPHIDTRPPRSGPRHTRLPAGPGKMER
jgi:arylsulfatase A-like enzyme